MLEGIFKSKSDSESTPAADSGGQSGPDLAAVKQALSKGRKTKADSIADQIQKDQLSAEINALYEAKNWEAICSLYFDVRFVMTGWNGFPLSDAQKAVLSSSLSVLMRTLPIQFANWMVASLLFTVNFSGVLMTKEMGYRAAKKASRAETAGN